MFPFLLSAIFSVTNILKIPTFVVKPCISISIQYVLIMKEQDNQTNRGSEAPQANLGTGKAQTGSNQEQSSQHDDCNLVHRYTPQRDIKTRLYHSAESKKSGPERVRPVWHPWRFNALRLVS